MDTRSFILGAVFGAAIFAVASLLLDGDDEGTLVEGPNQAPSPTVDPADDSTAYETGQLSDSKRSSVIETAASESNENVEQPVIDDDAIGQLSRWPGSRESVVGAEPKDDSWAYYMEQTILDFLSSHSTISQFDISYIECRTTVCQVKAIGYDQSTQPVWQQLMYDMRQQPWSEFGEQGNSFGIIDGQFVIVETIFRKPNRL